jgi:hypothetical protein
MVGQRETLLCFYSGAVPNVWKKIGGGQSGSFNPRKNKENFECTPNQFKIEVSIYTHTPTGVLGAESELKMSH